MLYLLHADKPLGNGGRNGQNAARHYLGYCADGELPRRLKEHLAGQGAKITAAFLAVGASLAVVRTWESGIRTDERRLKRAGHFGARLCPLCSGREKT